jgi:hypothetical protein
MQRRLAITASAALLVPGLGAAALVAHTANARSGRPADHGARAQRFVGYWMGIDPLDGGDSRRGITTSPNRTFSVIGRDTVFTLCDGTDRAVITGTARIAGPALVSDDFVIRCTNTRATVKLKVRYDVIGRNIVRETVRTPAGELVDRIIFHRVSEA